MRQKKDCISLWNKTCSDHEVTEKIRDTLRKVLNLPAHIQMEYRYHKDFLNWVNQRDGKNEGSAGTGAGDAPMISRNPTNPGPSGGGGFSKPRSSSPLHFDRGESIPVREGRGALQTSLTSNSSSSHR